MIILNCAFHPKIGKKPIYETFIVKNPAANWIITIIIIAIVITAILIAFRCNPENKLAYGFIAFLFSEIYLIQFCIRKYLIKEKNYCVGL
jgi:hypothetical protein